MFKLVVLSILAVAAAEPGALLYSSPLTYSTVVAPATTTITKSASSVVHPSPVYSTYAAPLVYSHFIKKRSPQYYPYYAPGNIVSSAPIATPLISTPLVYSHAGLPYTAASLPLAATHFIKKRSAPLFSTGHAIIAPNTYAAAPLLTSTYATTTPIFSSPFYSTPIAYSAPIAHFIKKRSAPYLTTYLAPTSYSHQSRIDLINHPSPILKVASYNAPLNFPIIY